MFNSKPALTNKHDPVGPVRTIVSKSVANFRNIPVKQILSVTISQIRIRQIAVATYRAVHRGFDGGIHEGRDWVEAEAEIDRGLQSGRL